MLGPGPQVKIRIENASRAFLDGTVEAFTSLSHAYIITDRGHECVTAHGPFDLLVARLSR